MIRRLVAGAASALGLLAGLWLVLSPFAMGSQPAGRAWTRPTQVTVVTGGAVALVGLVGLVAASAALVGVARRYGGTGPRSRHPAATARGAAANPAPAARPDPAVPVDELLAAVLPALVEDLTSGTGAASASRPPAGQQPDGRPPAGEPSAPGRGSGEDTAMLGGLPGRPGTRSDGNARPAWPGFLHPHDQQHRTKAVDNHQRTDTPPEATDAGA